jgi:uncharacterized protein (TIGR00369 family)
LSDDQNHPHDVTQAETAQQAELQQGSEFIRRFLPTSPYAAHLGMRLVEMQPDVATLMLPFSTHVITIGSTVHGGAIASLIDTAAMVAAWSGASLPDHPRGSTVGLTVSYLAAASDEDLFATARVLRHGRSLVYLDVDVRNQGGSAIAKGLVTYKLG